MCEVVNAKIHDARDKPIITCLEYIRVYFMKRIIVVDKAIEKAAGPLTPTATNLFEAVKKEASQYRCIYSGLGKYQVSGPWMDQCVVNLTTKSCSCGSWELRGIPCKHAVAAIWDSIKSGQEHPEPEAWLHKCYWLSTWKEMYSHKIAPINGRNMWVKDECPTTLLPPKHHAQVGRPKKKRKRGPGEDASQAASRSCHLTRKYLPVHCGKCGNPGHNARSCKGQGGPGDKGKGVASGSRTKSGAKGKGVAT